MKIALPDSATPNSNWGESDANDPAFKRRTYHMVDDGYDFVGNSETDVSSIENWDEYWRYIGADYLIAQSEISGLVSATGFANLTDDQKKIALRYFVAGGTNDHSDTLFTDEQHTNNYLVNIDNEIKARKHRDLIAIDYLRKEVFAGNINEDDFEKFIVDTKQMRESWIRDGFSGSGHGSTTTRGFLNFIANDQDFTGKNIASVSTGNEMFGVSGNFLHILSIGQKVEVSESTGNDGTYTVNDYSYNSVTSETEVIVSEDVSDATADGTITLCGFLIYPFYTVTRKNDLLSIYKDGKVPQVP